MNNTSSKQTSGPTCPACGAVLAADAPAGLCPKCLMREALSDDDTAAPTDAVPLGAFGNYDLLEELGHGGMGVV